VFTAFGAVYKASASLLPPKLDTGPAWCQLFATALQESRLNERRQIGGPARGFWQFELGGIVGVLNHSATKDMIRVVLDRLDYDHRPETSYAAIEHTDVLAFAYARLNYWWLPGALPDRNEPKIGWAQYIRAWNPGKPWPEKWRANFDTAWRAYDRR